MTIPSRASRGFTLAELLVSIGIVVLFTAVLLPGFNSFGRRNELYQTAQLVQAKISETKAYALAPRHPGGTPITKYAFVAPATGTCSGSTRYAIVEITQLPPNPESRQVIFCEELPSGIEFSPPSGPEVVFSVTGQGAVTPPPPPNTVRFRIRSPRLTQGNCRDIVVNRSTGQMTVLPGFDC